MKRMLHWNVSQVVFCWLSAAIHNIVVNNKIQSKVWKKQVVSYYNYKIALIKYRYSRSPIPHPHNSNIHAIRYFFIGIICGPIWGSFPVRDHLQSNLGIICGPGIICRPVQFSQIPTCWKKIKNLCEQNLKGEANNK